MDQSDLMRLAGMTPPGIQEEISNKLQECADMLNYAYTIPTVSYDLRGKTAGWAHYTKNHIQLNIDLLWTDREQMINQTLPHEFAHIVSYKWYGNNGRGHGSYWKHTMRQLGLKPDRCHQMQTTPQRVTQKFDYHCDCRNFKIGLNRHKKMQSAKAKYYCKDCKSYLREGKVMREE